MEVKWVDYGSKVGRFRSYPSLTMGSLSVFVFAMEVSWVDLRSTHLFIFG